MSRTHIFRAFLLLVVVIVLAGCSKAEPTPVPDAGTADTASGEQSAPEGRTPGMDGVNGLALGTLRLEGTENAVTPAQAADILPLWEMIASGSLQGEAETTAVLKQIEGKMSESQLAAIEDIGLTFEDMGAWMEEQGVEMPSRPEGQQGGGPGAFGNLSEEERTQTRQEFQNMTPEQRATRMAEMGLQRPEGAPGGGFGARPGGGSGAWQGGGGRFNALLTPLIDLLTGRAAE
ncbi:MAG: hypothetical protein ISS56_21155 [Anaerolineae bacterium]|nr:hypothetical protein [Anaerolineae bacterium]